ncbi:MAG TPA: alpha/beta hydrolase, partial [Nitrospiria bacterium]
MKLTAQGLAGIGAALLLTGIAGCRVDRSFIYHPSREIEMTPEAAGLAYEDVYFNASDGVRLNGWYVPANDPKAVMILFHGNAGNISHRVQNLRRLHDELGVSVFIFDYRGYGLSEGDASEMGTYLDAEAALEYVRAKT